MDEREGLVASGSNADPGGAKPPTKGSEEPFGTGGARTFSELDGFRREEGVLLRGGTSLEGVGPREGCLAMLSSRARSLRDERESRSLPPSERFWSETMRR